MTLLYAVKPYRIDRAAKNVSLSLLMILEIAIRILKRVKSNV